MGYVFWRSNIITSSVDVLDVKLFYIWAEKNQSFQNFQNRKFQTSTQQEILRKEGKEETSTSVDDYIFLLGLVTKYVSEIKIPTLPLKSIPIKKEG